MILIYNWLPTVIATSSKEIQAILERKMILDTPRHPGLSHIVLAKAVQTRVRDLARSVNHAQVPAFYDQIIGDVVLRPDGTPPASRDTAATIPRPKFPSPPAARPAALSFDIGARWYVRESSASGLILDRKSVV